MVCVYVTKATSLSHSQLPFMQRAGAKAVPPFGACSQGEGHGWLCCGWVVSVPAVGCREDPGMGLV